MIYVDQHQFNASDFHMKMSGIARLQAFRNPEGKIYAVCLKHPFELLCALFYLRERQASLLLIHADTPLITATQLAERAGCSYLLYHSWNSVIQLDIENTISYIPSLFQYSSGTTGEPKLIARQWQSIEQEIRNYNAQFKAEVDERPLILTPVSHSYGLITGVLAALSRETEPIIVISKNPRYSMHLIRSTRKTIVYGVPYLFHILDSLGKEHLRFHKLVCSGASLRVGLLQRLKQYSHECWQQYGSTETGCIAIGPDPISTCDNGKPLQHWKVTLEAPITSVDPQRELGEIYVSSGAITMATNDLGYVSGEGRLHVMGRVDDLINVAGLKVMPNEVERVIEQIPGVMEAVVYGTGHDAWGEAVKAQIVASREIEEYEVKAWCMKHFPAYKIPSSVAFVQEIPKMPSGKLSRKLLQEKELNKNE